MGRRRQANSTPQQTKNSIEDLMRNEENESPASDPQQNDDKYDQ
jgi:hypothetical protein